MLRLTAALLATACLCPAQENVQSLLDAGSQKIKDAAPLHGNERTAALDQAQSVYDRVLAISPSNTTALYNLGVLGWMRVFPALRAARAKLAMAPETPGPLPDPALRAELNAQYEQVLKNSIAELNRVLDIDPDSSDAMGYLNLNYRAKADLDATAEAAREDLATADHWLEKTLATLRATPHSFSEAAPPLVWPPVLRIAHATWIETPAPVYPQLAKQARIQGTVKLNAIITKEGTVANLTVVSGHPVLVPAAIEAAKRWTCRPTLLNGEPVAVTTTIEIPFALSRE